MTKDRAPRMRGVTFELDEPTTVTHYSLGPRGEMVLHSGDKVVSFKNAKAAEWRETAKGLKVYSQVDLKEGQSFFDPERMLNTQDLVFGIDTNQLQIDGVTIGISSLSCATGVIPQGDYPRSIQQVLGLDFTDQECSAERIGWLFAIRTLLNAGSGNAHKITLCTDHDMNAHSAINRREQPIIRDFYLPENFTIMYARDKGSAVQNKCVHLSHIGATHIGKKLVQERPPLQNVVDELMLEGDRGRLRYWYSEVYHKYFGPNAKPYSEKATTPPR